MSAHDDLEVFRSSRLRSLLARTRDVLAKRDGELSGMFTLKDLDEQDVRNICGFLGTEPGNRPDQVKVRLEHFDTVVRDGYGLDLLELFDALGEPVRFRSQARREAEDLRERILAPALASPLHDQQWFRSWLEHRDTRSAITQRVTAKDTESLAHVVQVLEAVEAHGALPAGSGTAPLLLQKLAVDATGDTKALNNRTALSRLVLPALAARRGTTRPDEKDAEENRALWEENDVVQDDLASRVLVLNLPAEGAVLGAWLTEAADHGVPLQVTLHQLVRFPPVPTARVIHVCENPAVLRKAAEDLGAASAPLICTEGWPSAAFHRIASASVTAGARLRYHGDFDWAGMHIAERVMERYGADPWRMSAVDYLGHVRTESPELRGRERATPWDPALAVAMRERGRVVFEESVDSALLEDLTAR
ncbi:TIGR02679 family protein [Nocardiopsis prasina]|uniref:TIGR02679 family protein n=1 Tax=Nocardiopsis prasina TaxID=2015 RepID=UPI0003467D1E|nr:TIGR02679 family protein [Nocardiopsis prasina]